MKIIEFDIPKWIVPKKPYWIKKKKLIVFASKNKIQNYEYFSPEYNTRLILYEYDENSVKQILRDFIIFSEFLYRDNIVHCWFRSFPLTKNQLPKYEKEIDNLEEYIKSETVEYQDYIFVHEYKEHPLYEITSKQTRINFKKYFNSYCKLSNEDKTKQLIDFFTANSISQSTLQSVYANSNMYINNYFIIIEALINLEVKDQSGSRICPECGYEMPTKKKMTDLIKSFADKQYNYKPKDRELLKEILLAHYRLRNVFSHDAQYGNALEKFKKAVKKLNQKGLSIQEEIEHADGSMMGANAIDGFLRIKLLHMLANGNTKV